MTGKSSHSADAVKTHKGWIQFNSQKYRGFRVVVLKRALILEMKRDNSLWGCRRISNELKKLNIDIHQTTVNKIIRYDLTQNPCREFVKQRVEQFSEDFPDKKTLIYDNATQFTSIDYSWYNIKGVNICTSAPNIECIY